MAGIEGDGRIPFEELRETDLLVDHLYLGGPDAGHDALHQLLQVGNQGGFRPRGSVTDQAVRLVALLTTGREPDWPDSLDLQTGRFIYYGDNRRHARELHDTPSKFGNLLLRDIFEWSRQGSEQRARVPPIFLFESAKPGRSVRFRGLLVPGADGASPDEELSAVWRSKDNGRFQNYRALFTVLDEARVPRDWIREVDDTGERLGPSCPPSWRAWVKARTYTPLTAAPITKIRTQDEQLPTDKVGWAILEAVKNYFPKGEEHLFEPCAVAIWRMIGPRTGNVEVTPRSRDGGRDAVGQYILGLPSDPIPLGFALEAKCWVKGNSVGVKDVGRLISRLKHREFGVFVTTSYFNREVYKEIREDGHPVVLLSGGDIVETLRQNGYGDVRSVENWLRTAFPLPDG